MRDFSVGNLITSYRTRLGKLQKEVANPDDPNLLSVALRTYQGWENGERIPSNKWLRRLANFFHLTDDEADELYRAAAQVAPEIENLPFRQNPFFTGRKTYLEQLDQHLKKSGSVALTQPISISGLGGIGKTQIALEYAHRNHPQVYRTVLWANAADKAALEASYLSLARLLNLPAKDEREVDLIVQAVRTWLKEHTSWLLVLDNADDLQLASSFLPTKHRGYILLTTRSQIVGHIAVQIEIEAMEPEEGLLFLLLRSGMLKRGSEPDTIASDILNSATQLVKILEGHPLALDQAGAYIEETKDSFAAYMQLYSDQRLNLLNERGWLGDEHPETVVVTFEVSFQRAYKLYPTTADVLHFCSFLHPNDIPEELFSQGSGLNLNRTMLNNAIRALRRYSLIQRNTEKKSLSIHRLVQAVLIDAMSIETRKQWRERVVQAVNEAFPEAEFKEWTSCGRLVPHVQVCATGREHEPIRTLAAAYLLDKAGTYLRGRAQYSEAEPLLVEALSIKEQHLGAEHPDTARSLYNLAGLYLAQGKYEQAEPLLKRTLAIREQHLGAEHPDTARGLNNLAVLYTRQGKYEQAEPLFQRALSIREQNLGAEHLDTAQSLNNLASLYSQWGKYSEVESLFQRALSISEQNLGAEHPDIAFILDNLAILYTRQGKYEQAEPLSQRALSIREQNLGAEHPDTVRSLHNLADLYSRQRKYSEAESLFQRALSIGEQNLGAEHPDTASSLNNLAILYTRQGKYEQAEPLFQRALSIREQNLGAEHPDTAHSLHGLAELYQHQGKYQQAEVLYLRALAIREQRLGSTHPETQDIRKDYAAFLRLVGRDAEAILLETAHEPSTEEDH